MNKVLELSGTTVADREEVVPVLIFSYDIAVASDLISHKKYVSYIREKSLK